MVDATDSKSVAARHAGSSSARGTTSRCARMHSPGLVGGSDLSALRAPIFAADRQPDETRSDCSHQPCEQRTQAPVPVRRAALPASGPRCAGSATAEFLHAVDFEDCRRRPASYRGLSAGGAVGSRHEGHVRPRIHGTTASAIGIAIVSGAYPPGHAFLGEIEQAEQLGISRTAYREAIRILAAKGLLDSRPKAGTRVNPRQTVEFARSRRARLDVRGRADRGVHPRSVRVARRDRARRGWLCRAPARAAAPRCDGAALAEMRRFSLATAEGQAADQRFHRAILDATGNETISALATSVSAAVHWTTTFKQRNARCQRDPVPDHERVYEAIKRSDAGAARNAMNDLLELRAAGHGDRGHRVRRPAAAGSRALPDLRRLDPPRRQKYSYNIIVGGGRMADASDGTRAAGGEIWRRAGTARHALLHVGLHHRHQRHAAAAPAQRVRPQLFPDDADRDRSGSSPISSPRFLRRS